MSQGEAVLSLIKLGHIPQPNFWNLSTGAWCGCRCRCGVCALQCSPVYGFIVRRRCTYLGLTLGCCLAEYVPQPTVGSVQDVYRMCIRKGCNDNALKRAHIHDKEVLQ